MTMPQAMGMPVLEPAVSPSPLALLVLPAEVPYVETGKDEGDSQSTKTNCVAKSIMRRRTSQWKNRRPSGRE